MENLTRITIPTASDAELPSSPHFDDEATLLTARPVVPIKAGLKWDGIRNYVLTAAVLLTAALIGAVAALSIDRFQNAGRAESRVAEETPLVTQPPADSPDVTAEKETEVLPPVTQPATTTAPETRVKPIALPKASTPSAKSAKSAPRNNRIADDMALSEPSRLERLDARRRRRVNSGRTARSRDVNRIREIFEGPGRF